MSRGISTALDSALSASEVQPFSMIHLEFDSGDIRLWTGTGDLSWDGETWLGAAILMTISGIEESTEISSRGINISLSGLPAEFLSIALAEDYQGRSCSVYFGALSSGAIVSDPVISFRGFMDVMTIVDAGDTATIAISVENRLVALHRSSNRRWTDEDQKIDYPNDKGFEFVQSIQKKEISWGKGSEAGVWGAIAEHDWSRWT